MRCVVSCGSTSFPEIQCVATDPPHKQCVWMNKESEKRQVLSLYVQRPAKGEERERTVLQAVVLGLSYASTPRLVIISLLEGCLSL